MKIAFGSDHAGYDPPAPLYKPTLVEYISGKGHEVIDCGTHSHDPVDYPDVAQNVCNEVLSGRAVMGVLMCGTGIGMSISANRNRGIRAAVCPTAEMAKLARLHNHANVLCFGRRILTLPECKAILDTFLETEPDRAERHERRVAKMC